MADYKLKHTGAVIDHQIDRVISGSVVIENTLSALDENSNKPVSGKGIAVAIEAASNSLKQGEQLMSNNVELIGKGNTLVKANFKGDALEGHTIRVYVKYPNVDYTGVTYTSSSYDRFVISFRDASGALISSPVALKCNTFEALASYYDLDVPAGTSYILAAMRAANGFVQRLTVEDITEINRLDKVDYDQNKYAKEPYTIDASKGEVYPKAAQIEVSPTKIGLPLSELGLSPNNNFKNYIVDIPDNVCWIEISGHYITSGEYGSMLLDEDNRLIVPIVNRNHTGDNMAIPCPSNAKRMLVSVANANFPTIICHPYNDGGDALSKIDEVEETITNFMSLSSAQTSGYQPSVVGQNFFKAAYKLGDYSALCYLVPIRSYKQLSGIHFKTGSNYGSVFLDKYCTVVKHISSTDDTYIESTIPSEAAYFVYVSYKSVTNPTLTLSNKVVDKDEHIFVNGNIVDGEIVASSKTLLMPSIKMDNGFHISLNEDYEFQSAHLYYNSEIVCTDFVPNPSGGDGSIATPFQYFGNKVFSANQILPQMSIRLVVKRTDGTEIRPSDLIIKEWTTIDYSEFKRLDAESVPTDKAKIARKRLNQLLNLVWKAEEYICPANTADYKATHFKKGRTYIGTPYSEASEFSKYVGWCVSFRTFLTACMNKRSVMYTECISSSDKKSAYGIDYNGLSSFYCNPYFGSVCTGLTQYVLNLPNLYISSDYHNGSVPNTTKIAGATSANVLPFDYLWNEGHCSIISDILLDEEGNRKYIVWAEQTFPVAKNSVYTLEEFDKRCAERSVEVWRYDNWDTVTEPEATPYIQQTKHEWQTPLSVDKDIHIFTGDYSAFAKGDPLFINVNRDNGKYSSVQVFSEDDTTLATPRSTIDITSLASDGLYAGEDWVIVDLTSTPLGAGKYKIRAAGDNTSGFAHFEIVEVTLNASGSNVTFGANGGTPILLRRESQTGMYNGVMILTQPQVEQGTATTSWTYNETHRYLKLYVQADYGIVVKRIDLL